MGSNAGSSTRRQKGQLVAGVVIGIVATVQLVVAIAHWDLSTVAFSVLLQVLNVAGTASFFEPWTGRIVRRFPATHDFYYLDDHTPA
jgi:hypothetical protein